MEHGTNLPEMTTQPRLPEPVQGCLDCARITDERNRALGAANHSAVTDANVKLRAHHARKH